MAKINDESKVRGKASLEIIRSTKISGNPTSEFLEANQYAIGGNQKHNRNGIQDVDLLSSGIEYLSSNGDIKRAILLFAAEEIPPRESPQQEIIAPDCTHGLNSRLQ
uniref:Uncharacterized protein n=1 Tax=Candidatus Kentrum sp. FW TaxID=2126338 RepID=A0A450TTL2_9GAMM|nr:MAG: hypothetical protein BECKFW1821C_GA0114237_103029 [Candidatus Kentron sp. FW]